MGPQPADSEPAPGPPDRQTLQLLARQFRTETLIVKTEFQPNTYEPRSLTPSSPGIHTSANWLDIDCCQLYYGKYVV